VFQARFVGSPEWFRRYSRGVFSGDGECRALAGLPAELLEIVNANFDAAAVRERADLLEMDRSLQADLTNKGMIFSKPDPVQFRAALVKAGFYTQWQKTYGPEAWARLERYSGPLT
jgi:TRAP-type C4-dicarboxylate transport system substrate-binding protein